MAQRRAARTAPEHDVLYGTWRDSSGRLWLADITWGTINGRAEPTAIRISSSGDQHPVTAAAVRAYPLATQIRAMRRDWSTVLDSEAHDSSIERSRRRAAARRRDQFTARRGVALSPEGLEAVADVYRSAWTRGEPVTRAVADAFTIAPSTAAKRIMMARRAGLLEGVGDVR